MLTRVYLNVLTRKRFGDPKLAQKLLWAFDEVAPDLIPEKIGYTQPLKHKYGDSSFFDLPASPMGVLMFAKRRPRVNGSIGPAVFKDFGHLRGSFEFEAALLDETAQLFRRWIRIKPLVFGQMVVPTDLLLARGRASRTAYQLSPYGPYRVGFSAFGLLRGLPDVYWATCLGEDYVKLLGRQKVLSAPAAEVQEIHGAMYIQLTSDPRDMVESPELVESARLRVIQHLGRELFFDPARPKSEAVRVPKAVRDMLPEWAGMDEENGSQ
jgi:hypothetical protein